jgi:hypothetical protein
VSRRGSTVVWGPVAIVATGLAAAYGADLPARPGATDPFAPAIPVGVAAGLPRSPLADVTVFGTERFDSAADAQARCPRDVVVRVEPFATTYRPAAAVPLGSFMCKSSALSEGDLPR